MVIIVIRGLLLSAAGLRFCHESSGARDGSLQEAASANCRFFAVRHSDVDRYLSYLPRVAGRINRLLKSSDSDGTQKYSQISTFGSN